jgi:hypothetical protein
MAGTAPFQRRFSAASSHAAKIQASVITARSKEPQLSSSYGTDASSPQSHRRHDRDGSDTARPGTLTATVLSTGLAAFLGLAGALVTFTAGRSMLRSTVMNAIGAKTLGGATGLVNATVDVAYQTLQSRATMAVVMFLVLAALAFFTFGGRTGVRIGLTVALLAATAIWLANVRDGAVPGPIRALDGAAMLLALGAILLAWLPPTQRFASSSKALRRG